MIKGLRIFIILSGAFLLSSSALAGSGVYSANIFDAGLNVSGVGPVDYSDILSARLAGWNNLLQRVNPQTPPNYWIWLGHIASYGYAGCSSASIGALSSAYGNQYGLEVYKDSATGNCTALQSKPLSSGATHSINLTKSGLGDGTVSSNPTGISCGAICSSDFTHGASVALSAAADGVSQFAGWGGNFCAATSTPSNCMALMVSDRTITATFVPIGTPLNTLTVQKIAVGNANGVITDSGLGQGSFLNINCGTDCSESYVAGASVILYAYPNAESNFGSWVGCNSVSGNACTVTMSAAKNVRAGFSNKNFPVTVSKTGAGTGSVSGTGINCGATCSANLSAGNGFLFIASPGVNSKFESWSGCDYSAGNNCLIDVFSAKSITANFSASYAVTVTKSGNGAPAGSVTSTGGIDCGIICSASFVPGANVALTASVGDPQYQFSGWGGDCASFGTNLTCSLNNISSAKSVSAVFDAVRPTLTITKSGTGDGSFSISGGSPICTPGCVYAYGSVVTISATPNAFSTFTGWTGDCASFGANTTCTLTMTSNKSASAIFDLPVLTLNKSGAGQGTVSDAPLKINCDPSCVTASASYNKQSSVTLTAAPDADSSFFDWSGCDNFTPTTCTILMNTHRTVTADFLATDVKYDLTVSKSGAGDGTVTSSVAGINCGADCSEKYIENSDIVLHSSSNLDSAFVGWTGCDSVNGNSCVVTMSTAKNISAEFAASPVSGSYSLSVFKVPDGGTIVSSESYIDCGGTCSKTLGTVWSTTLTVMTNNDYQFAGWTGDCTSTSGSSCVINFTQCQ
ncbi:MAG: hypothetical protein Q8P76_04085 [bacterium]|nr:hypothetical protein [bacterium]